MYYDKRNKEALAELAPNTQKAARQWYDYLVKNGIEVLIYDARRTEAEQRANVNSGASQTMYSYHLVGQALDFVPIKDGKALWGGYNASNIQKAIKEAQRIGFTWGGDWDSDGNQRDETFIDSPHLQYNYKGYGSDKVLASSTPVSKPASSASSKTHQVVAGDTLSELAVKYKTTVANLKAWNNLKDADINIGWTLNVAKPAAPVKASSAAIIAFPGDALYRTQDKSKMKQINIERIQRAVGAPVTGKFDAATEKAVEAYQKRKKLAIDGVVGKDTWNMLF
ncbi:LysM peptidoglycan-binding domain-containing protein [Exiguobacterium oxidotolerans]|uniref:LysM peptidoglycan-binding domain-containing protein n=1 Tax=Exiguobacterium oxidotolerans TaxID=223958 RepID=UPI00068EB2F2|nr:LysM peptidoglycan-binding domain-containing protein [Exiguobacterium oxidotolerans]